MFLRNKWYIGLLFCCSLGFSQVGINTTTPKAQLELLATNQALPANTDGILIPRIDAFPLTNPTAAQNAMMVYLTTAVGQKLPGFYYWDNATTTWIGIGAKNNWGLYGNANTSVAVNFIGTTDNQPIALRTNNSEKIRVEANGNTGIGITSPLSKLHVMNNTSGLVPNPASVGVLENNDNTYLSLLSAGESGILFGANGNATNGAIVYNPVGSPNSMAFRNNFNTNQLIISANGNIALGNFLPNHPLDFNSVIGDKISLWGGSGNHYGFGIQGSLLQIHSDNAASDVAFGYGTSAAFTETMRAKGNGRVGIGTTAPNARLQITSSNQLAPSNTDGILIPQIAAFPLTNPTIAQNGMMVFLATTVGTKTPGIYYWDNPSAQWIGVGSNQNWGLNGNSGTNPAANFIGSSNNVDVSIGANSTSVMRITAAGTVGIGNPSPLQKLDVNGNINLQNFNNNFRINNVPVVSLSLVNSRNILLGQNAGPLLFGADNCFLGESAGFLSANTSRNTFIGSKSGYNNYQGGDNVFVGFQSGYTATNTQANVIVGNNAGYAFASGSGNVMVGNECAKNSVNAVNNTSVGYQAALNSSGFDNSFYGAQSGSNTVSSGNSFFGSQSGKANTSGSGNTFLGTNSGTVNAQGKFNCFVGYSSGLKNGSADNNSFFGAFSGNNNMVGTNNAFFGMYAGSTNDADNNSFFGSNAGNSNSSGTNNAMFGFLSGQGNVSGVENTFMGTQTCAFSTGSYNTSLGFKCGFSVFSGDNNTFIGYKANGIASMTNATAIGANSVVGASNSMVLGGTGVNAVKVGIGVTIPTAELEVNGYTKLGSSAPAIKYLKLTGTSPASQGGITNIAHGLASDKILSVSVLLDFATSSSIPRSYVANPGYEFDFYTTSTNIVIITKSGNSVNILSKPFRILVTYEQ